MLLTLNDDEVVNVETMEEFWDIMAGLEPGRIHQSGTGHGTGKQINNDQMDTAVKENMNST